MTPSARADLGVGVVGVGTIGRVHARNLAMKVAGARLVHVADAVEGTARDAARELGVDWSTSIDDLLADRRVDAVVIATPPDCHVAEVGAAAAAGKAILCEKPLAADMESACAAVDAVQRASAILQVGFQRRFDPDFSAMHRLLASGDLGPVRLYFSSMRSEAPASFRALRCGEHRLLFDAACHELDAARWLVGEVEELTVIARSDPPDSAIVTLRFADQALGAVDLSYVGGYGFDCRCEVVAEGATLRVGTAQVDGPAVLRGGTASSGVARTFLERFGEAYRAELAGFVNGVRAGGPVRVTGEDGLATQALCEAAEISRREDRGVRLAPCRTASGVSFRAPVRPEASRVSRAIPC